ncbi:hypothetical protein pEaSNUABM28_00020 [Erwinia phage pEa_SNUABM_28]|uniref:Uncharacterized protein n=1 Tax=Erwinia phage pEa_SNUABM_16 TaxID=2869544 RepID=A0AAE8XQN0_9CAUD|nr:hypothetical protein MPK64_gp020 [Erwinia phage pEa_SNUABM_16]QZE58577.1 hypothetical protein pEaSNUABM28_00020 [Erwinia phage pEa_SNUABM_28]QZE58923.1 hypothetical protein pEaSNUABM18_00020 [Erwinia phage pEa_SNUABM_18]UAW96164.1 hypothetical protein pEaSNUABM16_00020 [Erwinia phage pEa_SNUABM_16]
MINRFQLKKVPTLEACQWNGENVEEMQKFIDGHGYVVGRYVQIGVLDEYRKPSIANVSVGNYAVKHEDGRFDAMTASELMDKYVLAD